MNIKIDISFSLDETSQMLSDNKLGKAIKVITDGFKAISDSLAEISKENNEPCYDFAFNDCGDDSFRPDAIDSAEPEEHWIFGEGHRVSLSDLVTPEVIPTSVDPQTSDLAPKTNPTSDPATPEVPIAPEAEPVDSLEAKEAPLV